MQEGEQKESTECKLTNGYSVWAGAGDIFEDNSDIGAIYPDGLH